MAKPDPALLNPARFPFSCTIEPRFGDLDTNMHLNNVALAGIVEDARVRFHRESGFHTAVKGIAAMVASFAIEYLGQAYYPAPLTIHVAAMRVGRTSYELGQLVMQDGRIVAFTRAIMVCVKDGVPTDIPQMFADSVKPWMLRS